MKILYVSEGDRDEPLLRAIITRVGAAVTGDRFPIYPDKVDRFYIRPMRGFGWVERVLKNLHDYFAGLADIPDLDMQATDYDFIVATIDFNAPNKTECRRLARRIGCVFGVAKWEFEAWILGERGSLRSFLEIDAADEQQCQVTGNYQPERDRSPKQALDCLCGQSCWEKPWDSHMSAMLANEWELTLDIQVMAKSCPIGFRPFVNMLAERMARELGVFNFQQW